MKSISVASHFWKWFVYHQYDYLDIFKVKTKTEAEFRFNELQVHIRAYCKWLAGDIVLNDEMTSGQLVISANSNPNGFKRADMLVARAPVIPNWKVFALRPPEMSNEWIEPLCNEADIDPAKLWFRTVRTSHKKRSEIIVYAPCILPGKEYKVREAVDIIIENLVGERSATLDIELLDIQPVSDAPPAARLRRMAELPSVIDGTDSRFRIDGNGKLEGW